MIPVSFHKGSDLRVEDRERNKGEEERTCLNTYTFCPYLRHGGFLEPSY